MDQAPDARAPMSVAPPGWSPPPAPVLAPPPVGADVEGADAAVRSRINAAILDNLLLYVGYLVLCALLHWRVAAPAHLVVFVVAGLAYHFVLEARDGQTLGKRHFGVRVVSADGSPAGVRAVAFRSVLRIIDQLPMMYVSGLVSMVRTGPRRRQRIGDVAGDTIVVAVGGGRAGTRTPGWLLPTATIVAVLISAASVVAILHAGNQTVSGAQASEFIAACQQSPAGQVVDCTCFLSQLEAAGYDTPNSLSTLMAQGSASVAGRPVRVAAVACRH